MGPVRELDIRPARTHLGGVLFALAVPVYWIAAPEVKLRPDAVAGTVQVAVLDAGRGECEAFQLALRAGGAPLPAVSADATPFVPAVGAELSPSREVEIHLALPSGPDGQAGDWPDPLVPAVDPYAGERRNAFPVDVPPGGLLAIWAEACVPEAAPPGEAHAELRVTSAGAALFAVPVTLRVHPFVIPATSTLPTSFGISLSALLRRHHLTRPVDQAALLRRYAIAALRDRISLHGMSMRAPAITGSPLDFAAYDAEVGPLLDGTALPSGARFTSTDVRLPGNLSGDAAEAYLAATAAHLRTRGWLDRAFLYAADEPPPDHFPDIAARARLAHAAGLSVLVTVPFQQALAGAVDIWTPNLNCLVVRRDPSEFCPLRAPFSAYATRLRRGERLWWYLSCSSHGCKDALPEAAASYFHGWPDYVVDVPGSRNRAMGPLAFRYGIEGELYYDTVLAYEDGDPWTSIRRFAGNGDGTLFYPGTPDRVGGKTDIPIESLRLKLIRAGLQDYEELSLLRRLGQGALAQHLDALWLPSATDVDVAPARRQAIRARLLAALDRAWLSRPAAAR